VLGIGTGLLSGVAEGSLLDRGLLAIGVLGQALPSFWLGLMLIVLFAVNLHWFPTSGIGTWQHLMLPTLPLAALLYPQVALLTRATLIEVIHLAVAIIVCNLAADLINGVLDPRIRE
jgi:peptide/nickel transport system permease protein